MRRVLITGGTGFVGAHCRQRLIDGGDEVHLLSRQRGSLLGCRVHSADLLDIDRVEEVLAAVRPTHLLHLAWVTTPGVYWTSPENHAWVKASEHLVRLFTEFGGRRVVVAGSCAEYDWSNGLCDEETTPLRPVTLYGQCKHELHLRLKRVEKVQLAWARLFYLYGPAEHPSRLVGSVILSLLEGQPAACSSGTQRRDFLHTLDAAEALVTLLHDEACGAFNVASGQCVAVREVVETIAEVLNARHLLRFGQRPTPPGEPGVLGASVNKIYRTLAWSPRLSLAEGVRRTVNWWQTRFLAA